MHQLISSSDFPEPVVPATMGMWSDDADHRGICHVLTCRCRSLGNGQMPITHDGAAIGVVVEAMQMLQNLWTACRQKAEHMVDFVSVMMRLEPANRFQ